MLDSTAKLNDIITALREMEGINQRADLKSALVAKGISVSDTDSMATLVDYVNGMSNIKSIQRGILVWSDTSITKNITISGIDINKSVARITFNNYSSTTADKGCFAINITSPTTVTIKRIIGLALTSNTIISWEVLEFNNVKSKQSGTVSLSSSSSENIVAVSQMDPNKSSLFVSITNSAGNDTAASYTSSARIISATQLGFFTGNVSSTVYWQLIEFN